MKNQIRLLLAAIALTIHQEHLSAQDNYVQKIPIPVYHMMVPPVDVYSSVGAAFGAHSAWVTENSTEQYPRRVFNLRQNPSSGQVVNDEIIDWIWDFDYTTHSGTTGTIETIHVCPDYFGDDPSWQRDGHSLGHNGSQWISEVWCWKKFEIPTNIFTAATGQFCTAADSMGTVSEAQDGAVIGNPILPATGDKLQIEADYFDNAPHPLSFTRIHISGIAKQRSVKEYGLGPAWRHNHGAVLSKSDANVIYIDLLDGQRRIFVRDTFPQTTPWRSVGGAYYLTETGSGWQYDDPVGEKTYRFDPRGNLQESHGANGWSYKYAYDGNDNLTSVTNHFGRVLRLLYSGTRLAAVITPDGQQIGYSQGSPGTTVQYSDGTSRTYHFENQNYPSLLTGISINGDRYTRYEYDHNGEAVTTEYVNGAGRYSIDYSGYPALNYDRKWITDPLGHARQYLYAVHPDGIFVTHATATPPDGSPYVSARTVSDEGLVQREYLANGAHVDFTWDANRRLPTSRTEAVGMSEERTTSTLWHPQRRLPVKVTEAGRETTYTYDSQGNPLGRSIRDTTGGSTRTWAWTYHPSGLVATETAPNGAITSYQYDGAGNLTTSTNALGQTDTYAHDGAGRVTAHTTPSGLVTTYAYDARGRMLSASQGGLVTTFTYHPGGKLATVALPHGHGISYAYDAAQRLTGWTDNRGASATYQLDPMGNRTREEVRDAQGQLRWLLVRTINQLNQVESTTVGSQQSTAYYYDSGGNLYRVTNGLDESTYIGLDALHRLKTLTDANGAVAQLNRNARDDVTQASDYKDVATSYTRDALGNARTETSPDSGGQSATYDALGLPQQITDALGRATTITRDALGRPTVLHYAGGTSTVLRYDLSGSAYNAPGAPQASIGYLSESQDPAATTRYQRDALGRITAKTQVLANAQGTGGTRSTAYSYLPPGQGGAGQIASITYPSGKQLVHHYDAKGQLTALHWDGQPLVTGLAWNPLGQPTRWQWSGFAISGAPLAEAREYTSAGQLARSSLLDFTWNAAGRITQIKQQHMLPGAAQAQQATITSAYNYDATGRLTASAHSGPPGLTLPAGATLAGTLGPNATGYSYDANGNRTQAYYSTTTAAGTATTERTYQHSANRLLGYHQLHTPAGASAGQHSDTTYSHDATGALTVKGNGTYLHYGADARLARAGFHADPGNTQAVHYRYNALGQRIARSDERMLASTTAITQQTVYADDGIGSTVLGQYSNQRSPNSAAPQGEADSTEIIYLPTATGPMPVAAQINGRLYAIDADHLNTPRRLTNQQGKVAWQWVISGFGETKPTTGATGYTQSHSGTAYSEAVTFDLRYPGQQWDEETQLSYNLHRYYDPTTGRYTQADPIGLDGGANRYLYAGGNPLNAIDPDGLNWVVLANRAAAWGQGLYYRYGPAITEFMAGASGVNGTLVSPMSPLVAQIPTSVSRMTPVARAVAEGIDSGGFCAAGGSTMLFRAVSRSELDSVANFGGFSPGPGAMGNKWFAESASDAAAWGKKFYAFDREPIFTLRVGVPNDLANQMMRVPRLDGIGPARSADGLILQQINSRSRIDALTGNLLP